ncbi:MAG: hypothetical protein ACRD3T_12980 [Terriglobia bacterium]
MKKVCVGLTTMLVGVLLALPAAGLAKPAPASAIRGGAGARPAQGHPEMQAALRALDSARHHLNHAATVYGGHRGNALKATDQAIHEIHAALDYAATKHVERIPPAPAALGGQRKPVKGYPFVHDALSELNTAKAHLQKGSSDFGGHRVAALKFTNQAIDECHAALSYVHAK